MNSEISPRRASLAQLTFEKIATGWLHQVLLKSYLWTGYRFYERRKFWRGCRTAAI